jgi:hypothetical protein
VSRRDSFLKQSSSVALRVDSVAGQKIPVIEEKRDDDIWTTFVAFPKPNLVLACTNRDYLREVLERIGGKVGSRALSDTLAEWKLVGTEAPFFGDCATMTRVRQVGIQPRHSSIGPFLA